MIKKNFAVFILAHGRPEKCITVKNLRRAGYTGKIYIILDNEDNTVDEYKRLFGEENCIIFDKLAIAKKFDAYDNFENRNVVVYPRNACFDIAENLGLTYFLELDDDYREFKFKVPVGDSLTTPWVEDLDSICELMLDFLDETGALTVAFAQAGDFIGGINGSVWKGQIKRKAMNSFFCRTDRRFNFVGRLNEDINTYVSLGQIGELFFQTPLVSITQQVTQEQKGGLTDIYLQYGTYVKSFYPIMSRPDCVKIHTLGQFYPRIHCTVDWNTCVPKIISDRFKK